MDSLVSLLVNVYHKDNPLHFFQALDSVVLQSSRPLEVLIVSDGFLTPDLHEVVDHFLAGYEWFSFYQTEKT